MHQITVNCENCGQEEIVEASDPDGTPIDAGEYRARAHGRGHMVVCDLCASELGYRDEPLT